MLTATQLALLLCLAPAIGPPGPDQPLAPSQTVQPTGLDQPIDEITPDGQVLVLTLQAALELGLERDRLVRIGKLDAISARASHTQAWAVYQPQLDFFADYSKFESTRTGIQLGQAGATSSHSVGFTVRQVIFDTAQGLYSIYRTRQEAKAAGYREIETTLSVASRIVGDFYDAITAQALETLSRELLAQSEKELALAQARLANQTGARLDVTRAEVAVRNAAVELTAATNRYRDACARLRFDLLLPPATPLEISDAYNVPPVDLGLQEALDAALAEQPSIAAAGATRRARLHALTSAKLSRWVSADITASFERYLESSRNVEQEYNIGFSLEIPLWDGQSGEAAETAAIQSYQRADLQYRQAIDEAELAVEQAHLNWNNAVDRLVAAEAAAELAEQTMHETEESFELGVASFLDVTNARAEYQRAISNRIQARVDRDRASIDLRLAVGRYPLPEMDPQPAGQEVGGE